MKNNILEYGNEQEAFTLAEVLITLGIIGVVAAMTVPTLIAKYFDKAMEAKYKKVISSLANGYKLMLNKEGVYDVAQLALQGLELLVLVGQQLHSV